MTIWELRTLFNGICYRLFAFWDTDSETLIVVTHGVIKKTQKTTAKEIARAEEIRRLYFELKNKFLRVLSVSYLVYFWRKYTVIMPFPPKIISEDGNFADCDFTKILAEGRKARGLQWVAAVCRNQIR